MQYKGVNISGLEFGKGHTVWKNYAVPGESYFDYWGQEAGANIVRIPFKWERVQTELGGELNKQYLKYIQDSVNHARDNGMTAILDLHNYGKYDGNMIGNGKVTVNHLADVWKKLGHIFDGQKDVWLNLMNEPYDFKASDWAKHTQKVVDVLRAEGIDNKLLLSGTAWSGAHSWVKSGNAAAYKDFHDPLNNFAFDVHQYLDEWSTGTHGRVMAGYGSRALKDITKWAKEHDMKLFLGETGAADPNIPGQQHALTELRAMFDVMEANADVWMGWTLWGAGPWWGDNYHFNINPKKLANGEFSHDPVITKILNEFKLPVIDDIVNKPTNRAPDAVNDAVKGLQDKVITGNVLENDRDADKNTLTASMHDKPDYGKIVLNKDGSFSYTPEKGFTGKDSFVYSVSDGKGGTDKATVNLTIEALPKSPVNTGDTFNFNTKNVSSYSSEQDRHGSPQISADGKSLTLTGNSWKKFALPDEYRVSKNSVLEFEFKSTGKGEIQGIGLDNDGKWDNGQPSWQLYGNQSMGFTNNDFTYTDTGKWQSFSISLAKYAGKEYDYLFFMNDNDGNKSGVNAGFRNVKFKENTPSDSPLNLDDLRLSSYSKEQDIHGKAVISNDGEGITLTGNSWKSLALPEVETFTSKSVLTFEFKSNKEGEIQGIGFDNDGKWNNGQPSWHLFGKQPMSFTNNDFHYTNKGDWQTFSISLAEHAGESYSRMIFINDNDANLAGVDASFRNIEIFEL